MTNFYIFLGWSIIGIVVSSIKWPGLDHCWFSEMADQANYGDTMDVGMYFIAGVFLWPLLIIFYLIKLTGLMIEAIVKLIDLWKQ